ncbi:molybdate ABC transporter substrate-binding protein [Pseudonocardia sp.]|uniref:molybdate ABC transporter substrate-binding protein n=1 Tax=Pseudonocardia sp. TaxID=60912 RepID=UPI00262E4BCF|nr:molybdate ABC transporter substrate-binding protein [Pseudonocardia sp.]
MRVLAAGAVATTLLLAGCGGGTASPEDRTLTVSAAASLTDVFTELEARFEAADPGVDVVLNFAGSSDLSSQIVNGAPVDVFASADDSRMTVVTDAGLAEGEPQVFVTNRLQIAVAPGNPEGIDTFADLTDPEITLVVCAPQVPCGAATESVEAASGVTPAPVSEEPDVRSVLSKVTSGEADAGLVYVTDVISAGDQVDGVDFPESDAALNEYPIAALANAPQPELAAAFVELVLSPEGAAVFETAGFGTP